MRYKFPFYLDSLALGAFEFCRQFYYFSQMICKRPFKDLPNDFTSILQNLHKFEMSNLSESVLRKLKSTFEYLQVSIKSFLNDFQMVSQ